MSGVDLERVMLVTGGSRQLSLMNAGVLEKIFHGAGIRG